MINKRKGKKKDPCVIAYFIIFCLHCLSYESGINLTNVEDKHHWNVNSHICLRNYISINFPLP